jgi:uncharacterized membrane protein
MASLKFPSSPGSAGPGIDVVQAERWGGLLAGGSLALFGLTRRNSHGLALAAAGAALIAKGLVGSRFLAATASGAKRVSVERAVTINRPVEELYRYWRDFRNLPRVMRHLEAVEVLDERRSRWVAKAPLGGRVSWEAEVVDDRPNERIAWRSLPDAEIPNSGEVTFREGPVGRGTEVVVRLRYEPPAGALGKTVAKIAFEEPDQQVREDLRRFKAVMETGEAPTTDGQPSGREPEE